MTFEEILDQALALLQRRGRVTYRALQLQFQLDADHLAAVKDELLYTHPEVRDDAGRGLIWTSDPGPTPAAHAALAEPSVPVPLTYTPPYLAEKILTSRGALAGERKQCEKCEKLLHERRDSIRPRSRAIVAPSLCEVTARDHRLPELSREVPIRRGTLRAKTVEEDPLREVPAGVRDPQPGLRSESVR